MSIYINPDSIENASIEMSKLDDTTVQEKLVSGTNIKTINNQSILGSGNINIQGSGGSSDYNDLSNKPSINSVTLSGNKSLSDLGINIPTSLSQLSEDLTHRLTTDTEKSVWNGKQDALVSGTNIKSINSYSLLGSGNLSIEPAMTISSDVIGSNSYTLQDYDNSHYIFLDTNWFSAIRLLVGSSVLSNKAYPHYVLLMNESPNDVIVTLPTGIIAPIDTFTIPAEKYVEISYIITSHGAVLTISQELLTI